MPLIKVPLIKTLTCPPALLHLVSCFCPHCPYGFTVDTFKDCHEAEEVRSREEQEGEKGERVRESGATEEREVAGKVPDGGVEETTRVLQDMTRVENMATESHGDTCSNKARL